MKFFIIWTLTIWMAILQDMAILNPVCICVYFWTHYPVLLSVCLLMHQYHTLLITVTWLYALLSDRASLLSILFFFQNFLFYSYVFSFPGKLQRHHCLDIKNIYWYFIEISWDLELLSSELISFWYSIFQYKNKLCSFIYLYFLFGTDFKNFIQYNLA